MIMLLVLVINSLFFMGTGQASRQQGGTCILEDTMQRVDKNQIDMASIQENMRRLELKLEDQIRLSEAYKKNITELEQTIEELKANQQNVTTPEGTVLQLEGLKTNMKEMQQDMQFKIDRVELEYYVEEQGNRTSALDSKIDDNVSILRGMGSQTMIKMVEIEEELKDKLSDVWPEGTFGLLSPRLSCVRAATSNNDNSPCPRGEWQQGTRYQDTENSGSEQMTNIWPSSQCVTNRFSSSHIELKYCMKTERGGEIKKHWPMGTYCIYKRGDCPSGFSVGWVKWDDENSNNANTKSGQLPDGYYGGDTLIYFCCRNDAPTTQKISLPVEKPFYLVAKTSSCQQVYGMTVEMHTVHWNDEDNNGNEMYGSLPYLSSRPRNTEMKFCYYRKIQN